MSKGWRITLGLGCLVAAVGGVWLFRAFNPEDYAFFPRCPFKMLTGWQCPACGMQRSLHALFNGEFYRALSCNFFVVISIPYFIAVLLTTFWNTPRMRSWCRWVQHPYAMVIYAVLFCVWWILRNYWGI